MSKNGDRHLEVSIPASDAAAENPPIDVALHLIADGETGSVDAAGLLDAAQLRKRGKFLEQTTTVPTEGLRVSG